MKLMTNNDSWYKAKTHFDRSSLLADTAFRDCDRPDQKTLKVDPRSFYVALLPCVNIMRWLWCRHSMVVDSSAVLGFMCRHLIKNVENGAQVHLKNCEMTQEKCEPRQNPESDSGSL